MRVLTFNSHQPYLHLLAGALPWNFGVVTPRNPAGRTLIWDPAIRPVPPNAELFDSVAAAARRRWDWLLLHNVHDLLDSRDLDLPRVFLVHGTLTGRLLQDRSDLDRGAYLEKLGLLLERYRCRAVYISELKRLDWGLPGTVIHHGIDAGSFGGYRGEREGILAVSNHLRERGSMLGWDTFDAVCKDLPHLLLGRNPGLGSSRVSTGWEDLREQYRSWRVFLYTAKHPYEDGYNLALLEAMATGMPVATLEHPTSPIRDGVEGIVAGSPVELKAKILELLRSPQDAARLGENARSRVGSEFPLRRFADRWSGLAAEILGKGVPGHPGR